MDDDDDILLDLLTYDDPITGGKRTAGLAVECSERHLAATTKLHGCTKKKSKNCIPRCKHCTRILHLSVLDIN